MSAMESVDVRDAHRRDVRLAVAAREYPLILILGGIVLLAFRAVTVVLTQLLDPARQNSGENITYLVMAAVLFAAGFLLRTDAVPVHARPWVFALAAILMGMGLYVNVIFVRDPLSFAIILLLLCACGAATLAWLPFLAEAFVIALAGLVVLDRWPIGPTMNWFMLTLGAAAVGAMLALLPSEAPQEVLDCARALASVEAGLVRTLTEALDESLPLQKRDGGFVRPGYDAELDETRRLKDDARAFIAGLQSDYAAQTECRGLRVKFNNMLGYFIEVPQNVGERMVQAPLNATFVHRQTMAGAMRFSTRTLGELEARIASAGERAIGIEMMIFERLTREVLAQEGPLRSAADAIARLDVASSLANLAADQNWVRPEISLRPEFHIEAGRHPVVETATRGRGEAFIANDCELGATADAGRILLVTGPNMAGKSTFLRQNALIAILAQLGSFVPAQSAHIGVVDRLFSRVGAADDLARGRSTFMVEMVETAAILNQATPRSLVILDEIGRGTATFDGLSIAWAALEYLHEVNRCRALFATHYHELTELPNILPRARNFNVGVAEEGDQVVFLHKVQSGVADRSYGVHVAQLAGMPRPVVERARELLKQLEETGNNFEHPSLKKKRQNPGQLKMFDDSPNPALSALRDLKVDDLSPIEALTKLYELKRLAADNQ